MEDSEELYLRSKVKKEVKKEVELLQKRTMGALATLKPLDVPNEPYHMKVFAELLNLAIESTVGRYWNILIFDTASVDYTNALKRPVFPSTLYCHQRTIWLLTSYIGKTMW